MLSLYQAERTRAEEQLHHVTAETRAQLQQKDAQLEQKTGQIQQKDAELGQARTQLQQKTTELDSVQQSLQVLTITVKLRFTLFQTVQPSRFERDSPAFGKIVPRPALTIFGTQFVPLWIVPLATIYTLAVFMI